MLKSAANTTVVNSNGISTFLAWGIFSVLVNGKPFFNNDLKKL